MSKDYDIAIIGSGPGGYVAAIRAAQLDHKVVCIEKEKLGGVCLNWGCIPTKALIKNADIWNEMQDAEQFGFRIESADFDYPKIMNRSRKVANRLSKGVQFLFKKNKIDTIKGTASLLDKNTININKKDNRETITAGHIIIATGAHPQTLPGTEIDGEKILSSRDALSLQEVPDSLIIIGAGAIGVEFGYIFNSFGSEVTIIEMLPQLLPLEDEEIAKTLLREFKKQKIKVLTNTKVEKISNNNKGIQVTVDKAGETENISAEKALMAIGVMPNIKGLNLDELNIKTKNGIISVDENYRTSLENIYAIGDVIGDPYLAHVASEEGIHAVEVISDKQPEKINYEAVPGCTYCQPQVASVGLTEEQAKDKYGDISTGKFHFRGNGKSIATGDMTGMVKVIFARNSDMLVGGHIIGAEATELLPELTMAVSNQMTYKKLTKAIHAHPTMSEAIMEAILDVRNNAIHQ